MHHQYSNLKDDDDNHSDFNFQCNDFLNTSPGPKNHSTSDKKPQNMKHYGAISFQPSNSSLPKHNFEILNLHDDKSLENTENRQQIIYKYMYYFFVSMITVIIVTLMVLFSKSNHDEISLKNASPINIGTTKLSKDSHYFEISNINHDGILAEGYYYKNYNNNGWNHLHVKALIDLPSEFIFDNNDGDKSDEILVARYFASVEAMGFLEGYVTCHEINNFYINFYSGLFDGSDPAVGIVNYLLDNYEWIQNKVNIEWRVSSYWLNVKIVMTQVK